MIPITENTIAVVAALIYNHAYDQDPDSGWMAGDQQSAPGDAVQWLGWSTCLIHALQDLPQGTDEQVIAQAVQCIDPKKLGHSWNTIWMQQTAEGDEYSTITEETTVALPLVRGANELRRDPFH